MGIAHPVSNHTMTGNSFLAWRWFRIQILMRLRPARQKNLVFLQGTTYLGLTRMKTLRAICLVSLLLVGACAGSGSQTEFLAGRQAMLRGEPDNALAYFERVAQENPGFVSDAVSPRRSIWTYIARAQYNAGRYAEAKSAAEKALTYLKDDYMARLYLGLTLRRPQTASAPANAFNLQEVTFALREGVAPKRIAALARERGVAFDLTKETESQLRNTGADNFLLSELKNIRGGGAKQSKTVGNQTAQASKELTLALNGLREWLNYTTTSTLQGQFWDPTREIQNQIDLSLQQLAGRPTDWDALISGVEWIGYQMEEENDRARRGEAMERDRQFRR